MAKVEFGLVKDKFWIYYKPGVEQPLTVEVTEVYGKTVTLSNGDRISSDDFYQLCEPMVDEEAVTSEMIVDESGMDEFGGLESIIESEDGGGAQKPHNPDNYDPIAEMMASVPTNELGVPMTSGAEPVVKAGKQPMSKLQMEEQQKRNPGQQVQRSTQQIQQSPLIALTEKGQTKLTKINFQLEVPTVNKTLFNALIETYPEDEIDELLDHFINKVGIDNVKAAIKEKLLQFYKPGKKHVTSQS